VIAFAPNVAVTAAAKIASAFEWPDNPQNCPFPWDFITLLEEAEPWP